MDHPSEAPRADHVDRWRDFALSYLRGQLGKAAPDRVETAAVFERSPLAGEGAVAVFKFMADRSGHRPEAHYVVVGRTEPNFYPAYELDADEAFSLHLGTRFMLVMAVAQCGPEPGDDYDAEADARTIVERIAPGKPVDDVRVRACFDVDGGIHSVLSCTIAGEAVYVMARDAPPGFSRRIDLPPQVVYRLHLGWVLRGETLER